MENERLNVRCALRLSTALLLGVTHASCIQRRSTPVRILPNPVLAKQVSGLVSLSDIAEASIPAVVNIASTKIIRRRISPFFSDPFFRHFFGRGLFPFRRPPSRRKRSLGSGVIVSEKGIILTNNHVVAGASRIRVRLWDQREAYAKVLGADPKSDVAVLKLIGDIKNLKPLKFGNSSKLRLGEIVLAIGNPFGVGQTVTMGIVSAKGRANVGIVDYEDFIQTDAAINPGNSGGALVNLRGELVGINTAILSRSGGYQGIGFAIPTNMARPILQSLLKRGRVIRGWLGLRVQKLTSMLARSLHIDTTRGVLVAEVSKGSPADKAGIQAGDVVLRVDGDAVTSPGQFRNRIAVAGAGTKVSLRIVRNRQPREVQVELAQIPTSIGGEATVAARDGALGGLTIVGLSDPVRRAYRISPRVRYGVLVTKIAPGSVAADAGIEPGDVILEMNRRPIRSVREFTFLYRAARRRILLRILRRGNLLYLLLNR